MFFDDWASIKVGDTPKKKMTPSKSRCPVVRHGSYVQFEVIVGTVPSSDSAAIMVLRSRTLQKQQHGELLNDTSTAASGNKSSFIDIYV